MTGLTVLENSHDAVVLESVSVILILQEVGSMRPILRTSLNSLKKEVRLYRPVARTTGRR